MNTLRRIALTGTVLLLAAPLSAVAAETGPNIPPGKKLAGVALVILIAVCVKVGIVALVTLYSLLWPQTLRRGGDLVHRRPVRSLVVGVVTVLVFLAAGALCAASPQPLQGLLGVLVLLLFCYIAVSGIAIAAHDLGARLQSSLNTRSAGSTCAAVLYGGLLYVLVGFLPVLGQLAQLLLGIVGVGAAVSVATARRREPKPPAPEPVPAQPAPGQ